MNKPSIFGREPAVWISLIEAALSLVVILGWIDLTTEQTGLWMAVVVAVGGIITAWLTQLTLLSALVGGIKAVVALAVAYGFTFSPEATAALIAFVTVLFGTFNRTQNSPDPTPGLVAP